MSDILKLLSVIQGIIGRELNINNYDDRLTLQKLTCILKAVGIDFGYKFSWYIKGPYSPSLATDAYDSYRSPNKPVNISYSQKEEKTMKEIKDIFSEETKSSDDLELIASILYLSKSRGISLSEDSLVETVKSLKPWYSEDKIRKAIAKIIKSGLFT